MKTQQLNEKNIVKQHSNHNEVLGSTFEYYEKDLGTTILALTYDSGVMMVADSRTSSGSFCANRVADKIYQVANNICCLKSGTASDTQFIIVTITKYLKQFAMEYQDVIPVKVAATLISQLVYRYREHFSAGIIVGGVDKEGPACYEIAGSGAMVKQDKCTAGSGSFFIMGFIDENFKPNLTKKGAKDLLIRAAELATHKDNSSGGIIRIADITINGVEREVKTSENIVYPKH